MRPHTLTPAERITDIIYIFAIQKHKEYVHDYT